MHSADLSAYYVPSTGWALGIKRIRHDLDSRGLNYNMTLQCVQAALFSLDIVTAICASCPGITNLS